MTNQTTGSLQRATAARVPSVGICLLNWNGWRDTLECLDSLRKQDYPNRLVILVDNRSRNESVEKILAWAKTNLGGATFADYTGESARAGGDEFDEGILRAVKSRDSLVLIRNEENTGFTGGCNTAMDYALKRSEPLDYIFLLNNDATLEADCITRLVDVARESGAAIVGAVMLDESGKKPIFNGRISMVRQFFYPLVNWQLPAPATEKDFWPTDCAHGGAMLVSAEALRAIARAKGEYLRAGLFMYHEGAEFHYHAARLGYPAVVAKRAVVRHKNAGSSGGTENPLAYYYSERNRILVANVVLPFGWKILFHLVNLPLVSMRFLKNLVKRRRAAVRAIMDGFFDGYRGREGKWRCHDEQIAVGATPGDVKSKAVQSD